MGRPHHRLYDAGVIDATNRRHEDMDQTSRHQTHLDQRGVEGTSVFAARNSPVVVYAGMYVPYFYIQVFAQEKRLITGNLEQYLLPIVNAAGFPGRLVRLTAPLKLIAASLTYSRA